MAPEQRDSPNDVDHRADIYSLGVVFYELLTGELPRENFSPPSAKSEADPRVDAIVQQALEKERARRQHSANEVKTQVETLMQTPSLPAVVPASGDLFLGLLSLAAVVSTAVGTWISWKSVGTARKPSSASVSRGSLKVSIATRPAFSMPRT
jgi:serine/threonine protein kinase